MNGTTAKDSLAHSERRLLFETVTGERYEQDDADLIYLNGRALDRRPPIAYGSPRIRRELLAVGSEAALLFAHEVGDGWQVRVHTTGVLRTLDARPYCGIRSIPRTWLGLAHRRIDPAGRDRRRYV
jgi:hypothetical protein